MNWISFLIGFISFPIIVVIVRSLINRFNKIEPTVTQNFLDVQNMLRHLLLTGNDGEEIFIVNHDPKFLVRVRKRKYKRKQDTMIIEVRNTDSNCFYFDTVKQALQINELEFLEQLTPKLHRPKNLCLTYENQGGFAVSAVGHAIQVIFSSIGNDNGVGLILVTKS